MKKILAALLTLTTLLTLPLPVCAKGTFAFQYIRFSKAPLGYYLAWFSKGEGVQPRLALVLPDEAAFTAQAPAGGNCEFTFVYGGANWEDGGSYDLIDVGQDSLTRGWSDLEEGAYELYYIRVVTGGYDINGKPPLEVEQVTVMSESSLKHAVRSEPVPAANVSCFNRLTSSWAKAEVEAAYRAGLVEDNGVWGVSYGTDYRNPMTRAQFTVLAVDLYEAMSGTAISDARQTPFTDIGDKAYGDFVVGSMVPAIRRAYAIGLIQGTSATTFSPDGLLDREQAATILARVYTKLGGSIPAGGPLPFADSHDVSGFARDSVAFLASRQLLNGVGNGRIAPRDRVTVEQAILLAKRMYDTLQP